MKTTIVPAQITTVEDKVAGNLSFTQLLLLTTPVFLGAAVFVVFPPLFRYSTLKLIIVICLAVTCALLAIRIRGKIIAQWLNIVIRYRLRPRFYLFNKNTTYLRRLAGTTPKHDKRPAIKAKQVKRIVLPSLPIHVLAKAEAIITDPRAKFHIKAEKGGLRVHIHEIKEENI